MYLLFLDESGTHKGSPVSVIAGIAVHEQDAWHLQRRLHDTLARKVPPALDPLDFELHAGEMKSPQRYSRQGRLSKWEQIDYRSRMDILGSTYRALSTYTCQDSAYPCSLFGAVVDAAYFDQTERAYEEVLHKFDEMLTRQGHDIGVPHQRGLVIHDKAVVEGDVQAWANRWRRTAGRIGVLTHLADVPVFADSKASRLIQAADLVAWALWRYYGLPQQDSRWIQPLWSLFDSDKGIMHGLIHVTREFRAGTCVCPPCASRRPAVTI